MGAGYWCKGMVFIFIILAEVKYKIQSETFEHQYSIPTTQYHLIGHRSIRVLFIWATRDMRMREFVRNFRKNAKSIEGIIGLIEKKETTI